MGVIFSAAEVGGLQHSLILRTLLDRVEAGRPLEIISLEDLAIGLPVAMAALPGRGSESRPIFVILRVAKKPAFAPQALAAKLQAAKSFVPIILTPECLIGLAAVDVNLQKPTIIWETINQPSLTIWPLR